MRIAQYTFCSIDECVYCNIRSVNNNSFQISVFLDKLAIIERLQLFSRFLLYSNNSGLYYSYFPFLYCSIKTSTLRYLEVVVLERVNLITFSLLLYLYTCLFVLFYYANLETYTVSLFYIQNKNYKQYHSMQNYIVGKKVNANYKINTSLHL